MPSNFILSSPDAYWEAALPSGTVRFTTAGFTFLIRMQQALRQALATPSPTWDGSLVRGDQVPVDATWGTVTSRALWAAGQVLGVPAVVLELVRSEANARQLTHPAQHVLGDLSARSWSMMVGAWIVTRMLTDSLPNHIDVPFATIRFPDDTIYPVWGLSPQISSVTQVTISTPDQPASQTPDGSGASSLYPYPGDVPSTPDTFSGSGTPDNPITPTSDIQVYGYGAVSGSRPAGIQVPSIGTGATIAIGLVITVGVIALVVTQTGKSLTKKRKET